MDRRVHIYNALSVIQNITRNKDLTFINVDIVNIATCCLELTNDTHSTSARNMTVVHQSQLNFHPTLLLKLLFNIDLIMTVYYSLWMLILRPYSQVMWLSHQKYRPYSNITVSSTSRSGLLVPANTPTDTTTPPKLCPSIHFPSTSHTAVYEPTKSVSHTIVSKSSSNLVIQCNELGFVPVDLMWQMRKCQ